MFRLRNDWVAKRLPWQPYLEMVVCSGDESPAQGFDWSLVERTLKRRL